MSVTAGDQCGSGTTSGDELGCRTSTHAPSHLLLLLLLLLLCSERRGELGRVCVCVCDGRRRKVSWKEAKWDAGQKGRKETKQQQQQTKQLT